MTRVAVLCLLLGVSAPARAVDGCVILLCLAGSWSSIPQCVGPVRQLFRDLARGKPFPTCAMARGPGGSRALAERATEQNCPRQYSSWGGESGAVFSCAFRGVIRVEVAGAPWASVWWSVGGDSVTQYSDAAKAQLGSGNYSTAYDDELARWLASSRAPNPSPVGPTSSP